MRDQKAIENFSRHPQESGLVMYCFADTTIMADEQTGTDGRLHLNPIRGDQISCGEWYDLGDDEVVAYCKLLEEEIERRRGVISMNLLRTLAEAGKNRRVIVTRKAQREDKLVFCGTVKDGFDALFPYVSCMVDQASPSGTYLLLQLR